jgi:amino acid transporter
MNIIYRNSLSITFAILSLALSLILFNAAKKYLDLDQYIKLLIIIIFLFFFIINIFLKKNIQKKSFYLFIYIVLILYSLNTFLGVYSIYFDNKKNNYNEYGIKNKSDEFDDRNIFQFIEDNKVEGKSILPYLTPREFLIKNENSST